MLRKPLSHHRPPETGPNAGQPVATAAPPSQLVDDRTHSGNRCQVTSPPRRVDAASAPVPDISRYGRTAPRTTAASIPLPVLLGTTAPDTTIPTISASLLDTFAACRRKYALSVLGLRRAGVRRAAADAGSFAHAYTSQHFAPSGSLPRPLALLTAAQEEIESLPGLDLDERNRRIAALYASAAVGQAISTIAIPQIEGLMKEDGLQLVSTEHPYDAVVCGLRVVVRPDFIFKSEKTGEHYLLDLKTTRRPVHLLAGTYQYALQPHLYADVFRRATSHPIASVIYLVISVPSCRRKGLTKTPDKWQSIEDYIAECHEWWTGTGRWTIRADRSQRPFYTTAIQTDSELPPQVLARMVELRRWWDMMQGVKWATGNVERSSYSCFGPYGACQYLPFCTAHESEWRAMRESGWVFEPDPLSTSSILRLGDTASEESDTNGEG